jgi:starch synthase (maltosyl-transferring)
MEKKTSRSQHPGSALGRTRVVIEGVEPEIDGGDFPVKRVTGEQVVVEADIFADGHDVLTAMLFHRKEQAASWHRTPMEELGNDRWRAAFEVTELGRYYYTLAAWVDHFATWRRDLRKRLEAGQDVAGDLLEGARLLEAAGARAKGKNEELLATWAERLASSAAPLKRRVEFALDDRLAALASRYADVGHATRYEKELMVVVDRPKARFSTWYEMFPRSAAQEPGRHGTFADVEKRLPYIAGMGFDVLYFPPIHPIGKAFRKGKNNALMATSSDPGSPWGIGSSEGGHTATHSQLGDLASFRRLVAKAEEHGMELALDLALQCSPEHPWVKEHPAWFKRRADGSIQYAENPPKKYQDIYPLDFESEQWRDLWETVKETVLYWVGHGVRIFRVDNPHTKPFRFWQWLIAEVKSQRPDVIFLAEAFTRPKVMYRLAKAGFTQSYTYFTWRNEKGEIEEYFTELTKTKVREFFRPNLWPNTPDILHEYLQQGSPAAFRVRYALAATLGASCGIYGPAYELCLHRPREPKSEEYIDSEKYEIKHWNLQHQGSISGFIGKVNAIRKANPALQSDWSLRFHETDNHDVLCYSKRSEDGQNIVLTVLNLSPVHVHQGWVTLDLHTLGLDDADPFTVTDMLDGSEFQWKGARNYFRLDPAASPAHIFRVAPVAKERGSV